MGRSNKPKEKGKGRRGGVAEKKTESTVAAIMEHKQRSAAAPTPQQSSNAAAAAARLAQQGGGCEDKKRQKQNERWTGIRPKTTAGSTRTGTRTETPSQGHANHPACGVGGIDAEESELLVRGELEAATVAAAAAPSSKRKIRLLEGDKVYDAYAVLRQQKS